MGRGHQESAKEAPGAALRGSVAICGTGRGPRTCRRASDAGPSAPVLVHAMAALVLEGGERSRRIATRKPTDDFDDLIKLAGPELSHELVNTKQPLSPSRAHPQRPASHSRTIENNTESIGHV